jgi:hypothetical protein
MFKNDKTMARSMALGGLKISDLPSINLSSAVAVFSDGTTTFVSNDGRRWERQTLDRPAAITI